MAIFVLAARIVARSRGHSAVAAAAYRAGAKLRDVLKGRSHDYSRRSGVVHSEILLPEGAPERLCDRETLWNEVEARERRKDSQLARELMFALPARELDLAQRIALARRFVEESFVRRGMIADLCIHDAEGNPHAHLMLTMRSVGPEGFGKKVREWNAAFATGKEGGDPYTVGTRTIESWREDLARHTNEALEAAGSEARIDHRSLKAQREEALEQGDLARAETLNREPQPKLGASKWVAQRLGQVRDSFRKWIGVDHRNNVRLRARSHSGNPDDPQQGGARLIARMVEHGPAMGWKAPDRGWPDLGWEVER